MLRIYIDKPIARLALVTLILGAGVAAPASAHPVPFSFLDVRVQPDALDVSLVLHVFDVSHDIGIEPPERLLDARVLTERAESIAALVKSRLQLTADGRPLVDSAWSTPEPLPERQSVRLRAR